MLDGSARSASERIVDFALELRYEDIPESVRAAAKLHLLDTIGCGIAAHALGLGTAGRAIAPASVSHDGRGLATIIGRAEPASPSAAAFANGMLCHALDFDDTHAGSICHIGVVTGPALVAVAEAREASGTDLVAALVAGSELIARLGAAANPEYMVRGFHPTSVCGVFGATLGAARLLDLEPSQTVSALGIAGSMSGGLFAYLADGSSTKPIHAGAAASAGLQAAQLAASGGEGPRLVFEDRFGFFAAYYGLEHYDAFGARLDDLGEKWETEDTAFKAYPACHFVHGCLDAAAALRAESGWQADDIGSVTVAIPDAGVPLVLEPIDAKRRPRTDYDGKFSLPYSVAAMLVHGRVDVASYLSEALRDEEVLELTGRVGYERRPFESFPQAFPGWVRVEDRRGNVLEREVSYQRGAAENPLSAAEVAAKFRQNAGLVLDPDEIATLEVAILEIEQLDDVGTCFQPLAGSGQRVEAR
jgi:2-methylcitrate dehydratase PrpD